MAYIVLVTTYQAEMKESEEYVYLFDSQACLTSHPLKI